jgi:signal transduction histidine kinase
MAGSHTDITMRKKSEQILKERTHQLSERVKELNCLFELSKIIESMDISLDQIYHQVIEIIPPAWQYPSITCAKLKIKDRQFSTENYEETSWQLKSDIFFKNKKYGSLTVGYLTQKPEADEGPFIKEERLLLDAISERLGRVIERIKVENRLKKYRQDLEELVKIRSKKLKRSMQRLNEIEEKMRKNAAQKLHDQVGQNLSALKLNMNYLQSLLPAGHDQNIGKRINDSINLLEETIDHITNIMTELRPPLLQDYGLSRALKTLSQQFTERTNIKVNLNTEQASARLPENIETTLFRVIQELFNNIAKHSQASIVDIKIKKYKDQLIIRVADDGIGFDTEKVDYKAQNTFGIMTMNERLNLINGSLKIQSSPGQGTTAEIKVEDIK